MAFKKCDKPVESLLERVLGLNIVSSDYYKELAGLKTHLEIVDEIYEQVDHVEPWMTGNCRGPSTAFCLLYKLFTIDLDVKQIKSIIHHVDSPYIRAVGFLYLRYIADPKTLWWWFEPFLNDEEEFSPGTNRRNTTMGIFVRDLLLGQYYFDSLFPRIPVPVMRQMKESLEKLKLPTEPAGVVASASRSGAEEGNRRPPSVKAALSVSFGQRAPHRASTRDSSPIRRVLVRNTPPRNDSDRPRDSDQVRNKDSQDRERDRDYRDRDRNRDREGDRYRERDRERQGEGRESKVRNRSRSPSSRQHSNDYDRRQEGRSRDGRYVREYKRDSRERSRDREHKKDSRDREYKRGSRERSRERERGSYRDDRDREDARDKFKESKETNGSGKDTLKKLKDIYGDVAVEKDLDEKQTKSSASEEVVRLGGASWR